MRIARMVAVLCLLGAPMGYAADPEGQVMLEDGSSMTAQQKVDFSRSALEEMKTPSRPWKSSLSRLRKKKTRNRSTA